MWISPVRDRDRTSRITLAAEAQCNNTMSIVLSARRVPRNSRFSPGAEQCLHRCAERSQFERLFHELEGTGKSALGRDLGGNRGPDYQRPRFGMRIAKLSQRSGNSRPRRIDVEDKQLGIEIGGELLEFLDGTRHYSNVLRREFLQRGIDRRRQRIVLLEQYNRWLQPIRIG